jgi:hypothetical protein
VIKIRRLQWVWQPKEEEIQINLVGKLCQKRPLVRHKWENNIKMDIAEKDLNCLKLGPNVGQVSSK